MNPVIPITIAIILTLAFLTILTMICIEDKKIGLFEVVLALLGLFVVVRGLYLLFR